MTRLYANRREARQTWTSLRSPYCSARRRGPQSPWYTSLPRQGLRLCVINLNERRLPAVSAAGIGAIPLTEHGSYALSLRFDVALGASVQGATPVSAPGKTSEEYDCGGGQQWPSLPRTDYLATH